jgi:RHS repeat-associated protein
MLGQEESTSWITYSTELKPGVQDSQGMKGGGRIEIKTPRQTEDLYYYRARYYDPKACRFLTKDPIGFAGGDVNLYRYVTNNPINWIDPEGLKIKWNNYIFSNLLVIRNLIRLNQEIINLGIAEEGFTLNISGGDRYIDSKCKHRSATDYKIEPRSDKNSPHLIERGARAVDLYVSGVNMNIFIEALKKTQFLPVYEEYKDGHIHINLPNRLGYYAINNPAPAPRGTSMRTGWRFYYQCSYYIYTGLLQTGSLRIKRDSYEKCLK